MTIWTATKITIAVLSLYFSYVICGPLVLMFIIWSTAQSIGSSTK